MRKSLAISFVFMFAIAVSATAGVWFTDLHNALAGHSIALIDGRAQPLVLTFQTIDRWNGTFNATLQSADPQWSLPVSGRFEAIKDLDFDGPLVRGRRPVRMRRLHFTTTFQTLTGYGWLPVYTGYRLDLYMQPDTRGPIRGDGYFGTSRGQQANFTLEFRP